MTIIVLIDFVSCLFLSECHSVTPVEAANVVLDLLHHLAPLMIDSGRVNIPTKTLAVLDCLAQQRSL